MNPLKIVKVGGEDIPLSKLPIKPVEDIRLTTGGKKHKTIKTFPRGILKGTSNPSKHPPIKKHTIRLITDKGFNSRKKTIKRKIAKMSDQKVKEVAMKSGLIKSTSMPTKMVREILEGGMVAGFVSTA